MKITKTSQTTWLTMAAGLLLATAAAQAQTPILFSIDMTGQTPTDVYIRGSFNNWGNAPQTPTPLTNNGANIWTGVVVSANSPGTVEQCKFFYQPGDNWEGDPNRQFILAAGPGEQVLPLTTWNAKYPSPPNNVTFQVDMNAQILTGAFTNYGNVPQGDTNITVSGVFNGWGDGQLLTNNPALPGSLSNIFSAVVVVNGFPGSTIDGYKFRANMGYESPASTGGNNRTFQLAGGDQVLPLVYYSDASSCDMLQQDTLVTFILQMTNGTPTFGGASPSITFNKAVNKLYLNGNFIGWKPGGPSNPDWYDGVANPFGPSLELTNNPVTSDFFQQTVKMPKGTTLNLTYKYTIDGYDNESPGGVNHVRYVRTLSGVPYTMPVDQFGTNPVPPVVESSFGNLQIGARSGGTIPITWSGRQCVTLQTSSTVTNGINAFWTDIGATEGTSSTNWPVGSSPQFFRLLKKP